MAKRVMFTTKENISKDDKDKLYENDIIVVEVKNLSELKYNSDIEVESDIFLGIAMTEIKNGSTSVKAGFFDKLYTKLKAAGTIKFVP